MIQIPDNEALLAIFQFTVFVMSFVGNTVVLIVIWKYIRRQAVTNIFIVNLAIADLFTGLASLLQLVYTFVPSLNENVYTCLLRYQIVTLMTLASRLTVMCTTIDRYVAICFPTRYWNIMKPRVAYALITMSWIYSGVISVLPFFWLNGWNFKPVCVLQQISPPSQLLWIALTLWIVTIIIVITYCRILKQAYNMYQKVKPRTISKICFSVHSGKVYSDIEYGNSLYRPRYKTEKMNNVFRGAIVVATITLLFSVCWLPFTYFLLRAFITPGYIFSKEWDIAKWIIFLGMASSIVNPFIYAWQRKDFKEECKRFLSCRAPLRLARSLSLRGLLEHI